MVDVGEGVGTTLGIITYKYPTIKAINFDLPHVIQHAVPYPGNKYFFFYYYYCSISPSKVGFLLWVPWLLNPSIPTQKAHMDQSPHKAQVSPHEHESRPRHEVRLVGYPIIATTSRVYCPGTPFSIRLPLLRRWSANDYPIDPLSLKNISSHKSLT